MAVLYNVFMPLALSVLPTASVPTEHMSVYSGNAQAVPAAELKRSLLFTPLPLPASSRTTCTCHTPDEVTPNNGFRCDDGMDSYCAADELCATSEEFLKDDDKWSGCEKIACECNEPLKEYTTYSTEELKAANGFTCTDNDERWCGHDEACVATEPFPSGKMSGTWSGCKECEYVVDLGVVAGRRLQDPGSWHCYPEK